MYAFITISNAGANVGPFNLYSDVDGYISAFESNIPLATLEAGFATNNVPDGTVEIRVQSVNELCNSFESIGVTSLSYYFEPLLGGNYGVDFIDNGNSAYVYGYFNGYYNGSYTVPGNHLVKLNPDKSVDTSFDILEGFNFHVIYIGGSFTQLSNNKLIVVGWFTSFNGDSYNRIIRLNLDGTVDNTFDIGTGFNNYTTSVRIDSKNRIIVTGLFSTYKGVSSPRLIRLFQDGSQDPTLSVGTGFNNATLSTLVNLDDSMFIAGYFNSYNGTSVPTGIAKITETGSIDPSFNGGVGFDVAVNKPVLLARKLNEDSFYAAGYFTTYKGVAAPSIIKLLPNGDVDVSFNAGTGFNSATIGTLKLIWDDKLLVQGGFTEYNGTPSLYSIILNDDGTVYHAFNTTYEMVYVMGDKVYGTDSVDGINKVIFTKP